MRRRSAQRADDVGRIRTGRRHADGWTAVCAGADLVEGGDGRRFDVRAAAGVQAAFVVRVDGAPRAYLNRCAHVPVELDWIPGRFLDDTGLYVVCTVHGAMYDAADGTCAGGPCQGRGLQPVPCREHDGWIWVRAAVAPAGGPTLPTIERGAA